MIKNNYKSFKVIPVRQLFSKFKREIKKVNWNKKYVPSWAKRIPITGMWVERNFR